MIVLQFLVFAASFIGGLFIGLVVHELGHAIAAVALTKQKVIAQVGTSKRPFRIGVGRLSLRLGISGFRYGWTEYDRSGESRGTQVFVALCGPLATILLAGFGSVWVYDLPAFSWPWLMGLGFIVANLRILVTSLLPLKMRNPLNVDEEWLSDSLDIWRLLKK